MSHVCARGHAGPLDTFSIGLASADFFENWFANAWHVCSLSSVAGCRDDA